MCIKYRTGEKVYNTSDPLPGQMALGTEPKGYAYSTQKDIHRP